MDDHTADDGSEEWIPLEPPCSIEADEHRQEVEYRIRHRVDDQVNISGRGDQVKARHHRKKSLDDSCRSKDIDDRHDRSRDQADEFIEVVLDPPVESVRT